MAEEVLALTREQLAELKKRFSYGSRIQDKSYVRVTEDKMEAWMYLAEPEEGSRYRMEELLEMLKAEGVAAGQITSRLVAMCKKGVYQREILVAKGKQTVDGEDGYYEYFFSPEELNAVPVIREDGSVDYTSVNMLKSVQVGDKLAMYHPAVAGEDGFRVDGAPLPSRVIREQQPLRGMSIERRGNEYFATAAGKIELKAGGIDIRTVHEVYGDVDLTTGKLEFFGDIEINGNVTAGVIIRAGRNLVITGTVESAELFAGGDIVLKRGIQGNMKGRVRCRGSIYANFIEQCDATAEQNIEANYILNSNVKAGGKVVVRGKRGAIIGGRTMALKGVDAVNLGNSVEVRTFVHAGYEKEVYDRYCRYVEREKEVKNELQELLIEMEDLIKSKQFHGGTVGAKLVGLNQKKDDYFRQIDELKEEIERCLERIRQGKNVKINAEGITYRGVTISIEGFSRKSSGDIQYVTYRCYRGEIQFEPFQPENLVD